jgi:hypothetical protein
MAGIAVVTECRRHIVEHDMMGKKKKKNMSRSGVLDTLSISGQRHETSQVPQLLWDMAVNKQQRKGFSSDNEHSREENGRK